MIADYVPVALDCSALRGKPKRGAVMPKQSGPMTQIYTSTEETHSDSNEHE